MSSNNQNHLTPALLSLGQEAISYKLEIEKMLREAGLTMEDAKNLGFNVDFYNRHTNEQIDASVPFMEFLKYPKAVLVIGAVHSNFRPPNGSARRDWLLCYALEALGYFVTTMNTDHPSWHFPGRHVNVNVNSLRHVIQSLRLTFPPFYPSNDAIYIDYFRSPSGYIENCYNKHFYMHTVPHFLHQDNSLLKKGGKIVFANIPAIRDNLKRYEHLIQPLASKVLLLKQEESELYQARQLVNKELEELGDHITNETQMIPILEQALYPWIAIIKKDPSLIVDEYRPNEVSFYLFYSSKKRCVRQQVTPHPRKKCLKSIAEVIDLTEEDIEPIGRIPRTTPASSPLSVDHAKARDANEDVNHYKELLESMLMTTPIGRVGSSSSNGLY